MAHEKLGQYDQAFTAFETGNEALKAYYHARNAFRDELNSLPSVERIRSVYSGWDRKEHMATMNGPSPVFIVGFPRSGTTLLEQILSAHSQTVTSDEKPVLDPIIQAAGDTPDSLNAFLGLANDKLDELREEYWERAKACGQKQGAVFIDKLPLNIIWLGVISHVFPHAKILLALRDPRDSVLSAFKQRFAVNTAMINMLSLSDTATYYDVVMGVGIAAQKAFPNMQILETRYEDMVSNMETETRRIAGFLDLDWEEGLLDYRNQLSEQISTPSAPQVEQPIYQSSIGLWRQYAGPMKSVSNKLNPWVEHWGYS